MRTQTTTYEVRLARGPHEAALTVIAAHMSVCERHLHAKLSKLYCEAAKCGWSDHDIKIERNALKRNFLIEFGLTGRQYNSLLRGLEGQYRSINELAKLRVEKAKDQIKKLRTAISKREATIAKSAAARRAIELKRLGGKNPTKAQMKARKGRTELSKLKFANHGQKRRVAILESRLAKDTSIASAKVPSLVFGSKKLLRERAQLHANDRQGIEAWRSKWERARSSEFLVVGSKTETSGCQSCVLRRDGGAFKVDLRSPNALTDSLSLRVSIPLGEIPSHGREVIEKTLDEHEKKSDKCVSIAYRFVRDKVWHDRKRLSAWKVFITVDRELDEIADPSFVKEYGRGGKIFVSGTTDAFSGALGVDLNADHLAYAAIDRDGNPIKSKSGRIDLSLRNKSSDQREAIVGDAVAEITRLASEWHLPIVIERLDFSAKKRDLKSERRIEYRRMLSSLSYSMIQTMLRRRAERDAVEPVEVNPAYTSTIGRVNYARRYGLSVHIAAAVAIARRSARMSERVNYVYGYRGHRNALPAPVEARKHVWSQWSQVRKDLVKRDTEDYRLAAGIMSSARSLKGRGEMSASSG